MRPYAVFAVEPVERIIERIHAAGRIADNRCRLQRDLVGDLQLGVLHRRASGDHGKLREAVEQPLPLRLKMIRRIEIENLGGDAGVQPFGRNDGDRSDTGTRLDQAGPEFFARTADRGDHPDTGNDDPVHRAAAFAATSFSTISATSPTVENGSSWSPLCPGFAAPPPSLVLVSRVASSARRGMAISNFSSNAKTISITSSDSAPNSSRRVSGASFSTGILSDCAMIDLTSSIIAKAAPRSVHCLRRFRASIADPAIIRYPAANLKLLSRASPVAARR